MLDGRQDDGIPVRIVSVDDGPADLFAQVPFSATLVREMPGPDRPDYWLAALTEPLRWTDAGQARTVTHVILAARYVGERISDVATPRVVAIAYVVDPSLLDDARIDFSKCRYVATGEMEPS